MCKWSQIKLIGYRQWLSKFYLRRKFATNCWKELWACSCGSQASQNTWDHILHQYTKICIAHQPRCSQSRPHLGQPLSISWAPLPRLWNRIPTLRFHWGQSCGNRTSAVVQWTILNDRSTTLETGTQKGCTEVHISVRGSGTAGTLDGSIQSATLWPNGIVHTFKFRQHISWIQYQSSIEYERTYSNIPEVDFTMGLSTPYVAQHFSYCRAWQHMGRRP